MSDGTFWSLYLFGTIAILVAALLVVTMVTSPSTTDWRAVPGFPICKEDELIIGAGDFDGEVWGSYECTSYSLTE